MIELGESTSVQLSEPTRVPVAEEDTFQGATVHTPAVQFESISTGTNVLRDISKLLKQADIPLTGTLIGGHSF